MAIRAAQPSAAQLAALIQTYIREGAVRENHFISLRDLMAALLKPGILRRDIATGVDYGVHQGWWTKQTMGVLTVTRVGAVAAAWA